VTARVLLVTGSRALTDTPEAEAWAQDELARRITREAVRSVVTGDARGPDEWAHPDELGIWGVRWCLSGDVDFRLGGDWWTEKRWLPRGTPRPSSHDAWAQRALARNRAMVTHVADCDPGNVRVLALLAPWSRTRGTQHTMRLAREHGLPVEVLSCPEAYGPRGGR
jgi:hypothetical protein